MKNNSCRIVDTFLLNERFLSIGGIWPLKRTYVRFTIFFVYLLFEFSLFVIRFALESNNLQTILPIMLEFLLVIINIPLSIGIRFSSSLPHLIVTVKKFVSDEKFDSDDERLLYYKYNHLASIVSHSMQWGIIITIIFMYIRVLPTTMYVAVHDPDNNTDLLVLPRQMYTPNITSFTMYVMLYLLQLSFVYNELLRQSTISLMFNLQFHVCAEMTILSHRILNLGKSLERFKEDMRRNLELYMEITEMSKSIEDVFHIVFLLDLIQGSIRLAICGYTLLTLSGGSLFVRGIFGFYASMILVVFYGYSYVGEQLMQESNKVSDAYYQCTWEELPPNCKTSLIISMICTQRPLRFTAGKCYTFSLYGFTGIVKTSMTYVSMFRNLI